MVAAMRREADTVVVGGGIVGLAAAFELYERGVDVLCLEAGTPGGEQSAGLARIFRHAHEEAALVALAWEAGDGWRGWEARFGRRLLGNEGHLVAGPDAGARAALLRSAGLEVQQLDRDDFERRYPGFLPDIESALLDPGGGSLRAARVVEALAGALGDQLVQARVERIKGRNDGFELGDFGCRRLILCAGAATPKLAAQLGVAVAQDEHLTVRVTFRLHEPNLRLPCLSERSGRFGEAAYGVPIGSRPEYGVGLVDLDLRETEAIARCVAYVERALPCLDPEPTAVVTRRSATIPGGADAMRIERHGNLTIFAGHNAFKFAPVLGRMIADEGDAGIAFGV
jgi:sarcosine oxidase